MHELELTRRYAPNVLLFYPNRDMDYGTPEEVMSDGSLEKAYGVPVSMLKNESDCQDAVQSAILTAYEKLSDLKHEEYFKTWLTRILINVCNKQLKYRSRFTELSEDIPQMTDDTSREVRDAIDKLPIKIRQAMVLYYIENIINI